MDIRREMIKWLRCCLKKFWNASETQKATNITFTVAIINSCWLYHQIYLGWLIRLYLISPLTALNTPIDSETRTRFSRIFISLSLARAQRNSCWIIFVESNLNFRFADYNSVEIYYRVIHIWRCESYRVYVFLTELWKWEVEYGRKIALSSHRIAVCTWALSIAINAICSTILIEYAVNCLLAIIYSEVFFLHF